MFKKAKTTKIWSVFFIALCFNFLYFTLSKFDDEQSYFTIYAKSQEIEDGSNASSNISLPHEKSLLFEVSKDLDKLDLVNKLFYDVRCLVCEAQSVADSNADFAKALRIVIMEEALKGKNYQEIRAYLVSLYGPQIMNDPELSADTFILWFGPLIFVLIILVVYTFKFRKNSRHS